MLNTELENGGGAANLGGKVYEFMLGSGSNPRGKEQLGNYMCRLRAHKKL